MKHLFLRFGALAALLASASAAAQIVRTDDRAPGRPGRVSVLTSDGTRAQVEAVVPVRPDGTLIDPAGGSGGSGVDPRVAQGSSTAGQTGILTQCAAVTGDQSYTAGTTNPLNCTPNGRLKVGLSSATGIDPATQLATSLAADLVACKYRAAATWSVGWTGSLLCDSAGNLSINNATLSPGAATSALQTTGNSSLGTLAGTVGTAGAAAPTTGQTFSGIDAAGNSRRFLTDTTGAIAAPAAGTANRVITKVAVTANTSTTICPASAVPVAATEIQVGARTGLGINGQSLTQVERGTAATTPDIMAPAADTLYGLPVGATNAITAYSATAFTALCIQTLRP